MEHIKFIITIVKRGDGEKVAAFYRSHGLTFNMISPGYGAAGLEILDYLGLTETEKDMIISIAKEDQVHEILPLVEETFHLKAPGNGIVFTVPITGISGSTAFYYVTGCEKKESENE
ncbi:MAG: hypothetical protein PHR60_08410 [Eubacteriales bacterium]|nr:hypothetical protein [Eubacteriales bacterium]